MPPSPPLSRRSFLHVLGWWLALGGTAGGRAGAEAASASEAGPGGLLAARASAVAIGRVYLTLHPAEPSALRTALDLPAGDLDSLSSQQIQSERRRILALHRDDFAKQRVRELGGFLFSETELRLAALLVP